MDSTQMTMTPPWGLEIEALTSEDEQGICSKELRDDMSNISLCCLMNAKVLSDGKVA